MTILAEFSIVPLGKEAGVSAFVARVLKIVAESGISYKVNPMGTVLEGDWGTVLPLIQRCHEAVMEDSERVLTTIRIDDRRGEGPRMERKVRSLEQKLGRKLNQ